MTAINSIRTDRIIGFIKKFQRLYADDPGHLHTQFWFACHAAFIPAFTTDMLYKLWTNFRRESVNGTKSSSVIKDIKLGQYSITPNLNFPISSIADLIGSELIQQLGYDLYEIYPGVKKELQDFLTEGLSYDHVLKLAQFIRDYKDHNRHKLVSQVHRESLAFAANLFLDRDKVAAQLLEYFTKSKTKEKDNLRGVKLSLEVISQANDTLEKGQRITGYDNLQYAHQFVSAAIDIDEGERARGIDKLSAIKAWLKSNLNSNTGIKTYIDPDVLKQLDLDPESLHLPANNAYQSICQVVVSNARGRTGIANGILLKGGYILMPGHVISEEETRHSRTVFYDHRGGQTECTFDPDEFHLAHQEDDLDYTIIKISDSHFSFFNELEVLELSRSKSTPGDHILSVRYDVHGQFFRHEGRISRISHGEIAYSNNNAAKKAEVDGTSGSPLLNKDGEIIGMTVIFTADDKSIGDFLAIDINRIREDMYAKGNDLDNILSRHFMGFDPQFLGNRNIVHLPQIQESLEDNIARMIESNAYVLHYVHHSIVFNAGRKLAFFSAACSDAQLMGNPRRNDQFESEPRLAPNIQLSSEDYKTIGFHRGHLARRTTLTWGNSEKEMEVAAAQANIFSNLTPQTKDFNSKTWLKLEDNILTLQGEHFNRIIDITGPVFNEEDPALIGVELKLPLVFWKIIYYLDESRELCRAAFLSGQIEALWNYNHQIDISRKHPVYSLSLDEGIVYQVDPMLIETLTGLIFSPAMDQLETALFQGIDLLSIDDISNLDEKPVKVYISYALKDETYKRQLEDHLSLLIQESLITLPPSSMTVPGIEWSKKITEQLQEAAIYILLLSPDFFTSEDIQDGELKVILTKHNEEKRPIIPVLLRPCDWAELSLSDFQALPLTDTRTLKPISEWNDQDRAWSSVINGIRRILDTIPAEEIMEITSEYCWCLDNGHGQEATGLVSPVLSDGTTLAEYEFNRDIVRRMIDGLKRRGIETFNIVPEETDISLEERIGRVKNHRTSRPKVIVSIHINSTPYNYNNVWQTTHGIESWYSAGDDVGKQLAHTFQKHLSSTLNWQDRITRERSDELIRMAKEADIPVVLTKTGFLDNEDEAKELLKDDVRQKVADAHIKAILEYDEQKRLESSNSKTYPKQLTDFIPLRNPNELIGRQEALKSLRTSLLEHNKVVIVNGLGGVGKTTLAEAYVFEYLDNYKHIAWVTLDPKDILSGFANAQGLINNLQIDVHGLSPYDIFRQINSRLKGIEESPNLLVLDNASEKLSDYLKLLPKYPNWHVLVTSREEIDDSDCYILSLDVLSEGEALKLFTEHCKTIKDHKKIKVLLKSIEYHTLTIEILAKTATHQMLSIEELQDALSKDVSAGIKIPHKPKGKVRKVFTYLSHVFDLSNLNEDEAWLMKQFTCLPPGYMPISLLDELINPTSSGRAEYFADIIYDLVAKGWLQKKEGAEEVKMHRIINEVCTESLSASPKDVLSLIESVTSLLHIDQAKDNPVEKFHFVPFGTIICDYFSKKIESVITRLQNNLAIVLQDLGDYEGARELLEKAVLSDEQNFGKDHPSTARSYSNLATVLQDLGDYEGARELLEKAVLSDEQNFGNDHPTTARSYSNLATVLQDLGDYEGAKALLERAVLSAEQNFGPDHPSTARSNSKLALVLKDLGDYEGAKEFLELATVSDEKNFGPDHPTTARSYSNLALVFRDLGDFEGAKQLAEKAILSDEQNFGPDHPSTARSYSNLALVLKEFGDIEGARQLLEKAILSDEQNFGKDHPTVAINRSNLASLSNLLGEIDDARDLFQQALDTFDRVFGENHPRTVTIRSNLEKLKNKFQVKLDKDLAKSKYDLKKILGVQADSSVTRSKRLYSSHGKILLFGEYAILDGAKSLAVPTKLGQTLETKPHRGSDLIWESYDYDGNLWFEAQISLYDFSSIRTSDEKTSKFIQKLLKGAVRYNTNFLNNWNGLKVINRLQFPRYWGLGSSSTLINNVAQWSDVNPFHLHFFVSSGSGYDIACAEADGPIIYQLEENELSYKEISFNPSFLNDVYFVYMGSANQSRTSLIHYTKNAKKRREVAMRIGTVTEKVLKCQSIEEFMDLIEEHESIISHELGLKKIKDERFHDFPGAIKSIGAWGGDFVMAVSRETKENVISYFSSKASPTIIPYQELVILSTSI